MENLCCCLDSPNLTKTIRQSVCSSTFSYQNEEIDDFKTMFEPLYLKILTFIIFMLITFFYIPVGILVIQFEKYGGDPLKRSVINQLYTQGGYGSVLSCIFFMPFLTWRIMYGPLNIYLAGGPYLCSMHITK